MISYPHNALYRCAIFVLNEVRPTVPLVANLRQSRKLCHSNTDQSADTATRGQNGSEENVQKIYFEPAQAADVPIFDKLTGIIPMYRFGDHNWKIMFDCCPVGFTKICSKNPPPGTIDGHTLGLSAMNFINDQLSWGHLVVMDPRIRAQGIIMDLFKYHSDLYNIEGHNTMGDWRHDIPWTRLQGYKTAVTQFERHLMSGQISKKEEWEQRSGCEIRFIDPRDSPGAMLNSIFDFDAQLYHDVSTDGKRHRFMEQWIIHHRHSKLFVALNSNGLPSGYAVLRHFTDGWRLNPLYANNDQIAYDLAMTALHSLAKGTNAACGYPDFATPIVAACSSVGLQRIESGTRIRVNSLRAVTELPYHKMYAKAEFWPM